MSTTPNQTPVTKKSNKRLPMIVDIAIDDSGKQLYQVHESSRYVRKEMPKSTNFNSAGLVSEYEEEKTPIRKILGTISPSTLNQKKISDEDASEDSHVTDLDSSTKAYNVNNLFQDDLGLDSSNYLLQSSMGFNPQPGSSSAHQDYSNHGSSNSSTDIWSQDVEDAFEEVLSIIPKNGLSKIKISGRSCGRNELISDYILTKTGKYRTRKQVSSHIQVIKNLGQKRHIIDLINDGPTFNTKEEQDENNRKFEEVFSKINLDKSLGFRKSAKRPLSDDVNPHASKMRRKMQPSGSKPKGHFLVNNFFMSIYDTSYANPFFLTVQKNDDNIKNLQLKSDANISSRFPSLNDFRNMNIPIFHNFVKLNYPDKLPYNYSLETGLKTNWILKDSTSAVESDLSIFTVVYSYGKEVFKVNDNNIKSNQNIPFLIKFWKYLLSHEMQESPIKQEEELNFEGFNLKGMTIKQVIYDCSSVKMHNSFKVPKSTVRQVLLWEFAKVEDPKDAITTTTRLLLPDDLGVINSGMNSAPQILNYSQPSYYSQPVSGVPTSASSYMSSQPPMVTPSTAVDQQFLAPIDSTSLSHKKYSNLHHSDGNSMNMPNQTIPKPQIQLPVPQDQAQPGMHQLGSQTVNQYELQAPLHQPQPQFITMAQHAPQPYQLQQPMSQGAVAGPASGAVVNQFQQFDYMNPDYQIQGYLYDNNYAMNNQPQNPENPEY